MENYIIICPNCGNQTVEGKFCSKCGNALPNEFQNNAFHEVRRVSDSIQDNQQNFNKPVETEFNKQIPVNQQNIPVQQQYNNQNINNQQNNYPRNQKSKLIGFILSFLLVGLGHAYVGKWGEGLVLLVVYIILFILGIFLFIPWIFAIILWIYSIFKTLNMIDKYNQGVPY